MASNSLGDIFKFTLFGESHGYGVGGVIDGCPSGIAVDDEGIKNALARRATSAWAHTSSRNENDEVIFLSGIRNMKTTGGPVAFVIRNTGQQKTDYSATENLFRPSHADYTYKAKYNTDVPAGTDRASGRLTAPVVVAGEIARSLLLPLDIMIIAYVSRIGPYAMHDTATPVQFLRIEESPVRCPDPQLSSEMIKYLDRLKQQGDTAGGVITCVIKACPPGFGDPFFGKLQAALAHSMMSIPAVKGFEYGSGFRAAAMTGSSHNDRFVRDEKGITTSGNFSGGIQGGITNGNDIIFSVAVKPVSSVFIDQETVDRDGGTVHFKPAGRHDVCPVPRIVPVVEAMAALVLADSYLKSKAI